MTVDELIARNATEKRVAQLETALRHVLLTLREWPRDTDTLESLVQDELIGIVNSALNREKGGLVI